MVYQYMKGNKDRYSVTRMARLFGVSRSAYYRWDRYGRSEKRQKAERELVEHIRSIRRDHKSYGTPRMRIELRRRYGIWVSRKRVARLLSTYGLLAKRRKRYIPTTDSKHHFSVCENILSRKFWAGGPGQKWVSDITYLRTRQGWLYLTTVIDLWDRKVIGWEISRTMEASDTVVKAFGMAWRNRKPEKRMIFHSDRGVQYCSAIFRKTLLGYCGKVRQSMSRKGNCWDNACAESFFKTLKNELETVNGQYTEEEVRNSVFEYIEVYYNRKRLHSALDYRIPVELTRNNVA